MNNNIPAEFYKRAAEIMTSLPGVDFMTIVAVLYAHNTWCAHKSKDLMESVTEEEPEQKDPTPRNMKREDVHATKKASEDSQYRRKGRCGRNKLIETEAKFLCDVFLKEFNANILSYTAWNFDGVKVKYDLEKETEENV